MNENFYKDITFDASEGEEQYYILRRMQNYESVEVTISWVGLDEPGGTLKLQEGINDVWVDIPDLDEVMSTTDGATAFQHTDFGNKDLRLLVDFGTGVDGDGDIDIDGEYVDLDGEDDEVVATVGIVSCYVLGKAR